MEDVIAKFFLKASRKPWCRKALALADAEERGQTHLAAVPSLKECLDASYGLPVLEALEASLCRAEELSRKDPEFLDLAAKWISRSGRDPRPFLDALAERSSHHRR